MSYYTYLIKNRLGIYYFRIRIPTEFRSKFNNRREVRKSLKTRFKQEAIIKAQKMAQIYQERFAISDTIQELKRVTPIKLDRSNSLKINHHQTEQKKDYDDFLPLSKCIATYLDNIKVRYPEKAKFHILEKQPIFERLLEIVGDKDIREITFLDTSNFFAKLQQLPANLRKFFTNGETIDEILNSEKIKTLRPLSPRTINKYMDNVTTLFRFFVQNGVLQNNMFENKNLRAVEKRRPCDRKQRFSQKDLKAIFETGRYFKPDTRDELFKESYYWVTLLALYTGARVGEISQLHVTDIIQLENIWCISITETTDLKFNDVNFKSLKNKSSCRLIPIHDQLIKLGFLDYVEQVRQGKSVRIFTDIIKRKKGTYGSKVGGWFNKNKKNYFNINNPKQSFHSFRHTFIDTLKQQGVKEELVAVVVGHSRKSITFNVYGKDYSVSYIKEEVIDKINYFLSHKKN